MARSWTSRHLRTVDEKLRMGKERKEKKTSKPSKRLRVDSFQVVDSIVPV